MKPFLIFLAIVAFALPKPAAAALNLADKDALVRQIQIIQREIQNMRLLLAASMQSKKAIGAGAYMVVDLESGKIMLQKNADYRYPIASVAKLMTAVVAKENIDGNKQITITQEMLLTEGRSPAIFPGLTISAKNLLNASLIQSTNDAAESLSYFMGKDKFVAAMNQKARQIGMAHTFFMGASGLSPSTRSTASDLAKLVAYINKNYPEILATTKNNDFWLPDASGRPLKFKNMNDFYCVGDFVGGKTGYTPEARQTFASVFKINGKPTAIIVLSSSNYQADTFKVIEKITNR